MIRLTTTEGLWKIVQQMTHLVPVFKQFVHVDMLLGADKSRSPHPTPLQFFYPPVHTQS